MRCIGQGLESLKTFCAVMSLSNPVEHKSHVINNKLSRVMKEVAEESMKMAAVEEYSSSPGFNGDGDTKTFNALSENKPYGDDYLIQKIECVGYVQREWVQDLGKLILVYSKRNYLMVKLLAVKCKEMRKHLGCVWSHSCSTDDEPMHWFCPTNPNTWCKYNAAINNNLQNYKHKPSVAKAVRDVIKPVFADLSHPALLKKCLGGKTQNP
ncbi:uncharacterized protein TNCV_2189861 [Trichonephila clavipes]|nr:uncharacterized protein TNCV_2189861 [Trichonephila clavipes]